ncbi:alpha/beta hydrolase [Streptomyces sp. NPDC049577]|uniref:alpha/beta hydrolase n=1 Tax=Streptomyces sp. NPDC049577 TaxID=3155153 RepID=UPI00343AC0C9
MGTARETVYGAYDQAALDRQYSPSSCVADLTVFLDAYATRSARVRATLPVRRGLRYGPAPCERLDFFPARVPDAPLVVFVHGGYWQELSRNDSSFPAEGLVPAGAAFAALDYGLAPAHRLDEIVAQVRRATAWLLDHADRLGVDGRRVHLAGSSAGAHLVLMTLLADGLPDGRDPARATAGAVLLSGVYDLEPVRLTYVNEPLGLDAEAARRLSPLHHLPDRLPPLIVARGGAETEEFARQHDELVAAVTGRAARVTDLVVGHRNHFDLPFDLADPRSEVGAALFAQMGLASGGLAG